MSAVLPDPTRQRFRALESANLVRVRRAELKRLIGSGEIRVRDVIAEPGWFVLSVPVHEVLGWAPKIGAVRVNTTLRRAEVWPLKALGALTVRQRYRLLRELDACCGRGQGA